MTMNSTPKIFDTHAHYDAEHFDSDRDAVLTALPEAMREFADYRMLLYAIVLIIVMLATNNPTMKEFFHRISPAELLRRAKKKKAKSLQKEGA